jgi:hypothetical protein
MTGRFVDHGLRILAAVALLLAVMSSPILPTRAFRTAPPPNFLPRNFAVLDDDKIGHSGQFAMSARPSLREADSFQSDVVDELDADIEDELTVTAPPASVSFDVLPAPFPKPYSELVSFAVPLAARPLRC